MDHHIPTPRLLPWTAPGGKPCYLISDHDGGPVAERADEIEGLQLDMGDELLGHAEVLLGDPRAGGKRCAIWRRSSPPRSGTHYGSPAAGVRAWVRKMPPLRNTAAKALVVRGRSPSEPPPHSQRRPSRVGVAAAADVNCNASWACGLFSGAA
ncbi:hypothetical protein AB0O20_15790 [Streptomyces kronopolitis]|uniref:hypothetical protein n=1 Tax=Streptomyces kronopolitis TaxID=1612435 RepID=UPI003427BD1B